MDDKREDHPDPESPLKRNCSLQLHTHNVSTGDVGNSNGTNSRGNLQFTNKEQKDAMSGSEVQENYYTLINTSSRRER